MISHAKGKPSLKLEPENGLGGSEVESTVSRGTFNSKTTAEDPRSHSKRYRDDRGGRMCSRGHGRGRGDQYGKSRIYDECKADGGKNSSDCSSSRYDDCRLRKLLRKLSRENDAEKFFPIVKQLQDSLLIADNGSFLRQNLDLVTESLLDLLHSAPSALARVEAARCLGRVGYALQSDFRRFLTWIFAKFSHERNEAVRVLLMKALLETAELELHHPILKDFAPSLMMELKMALESANVPELLISCVDVILVVINIYPESFEPYFRDAVDILVGWGMSLHEPGSLSFVLRSLQQLQHYWLADTSYAISLLALFLEDTEVHIEDLQTAILTDDAEKVSPEEIVSLLKIFNTVAHCISPIPASPDSEPSLTTYLKVIGKGLLLCPSSSLVSAANVGAGILLSQYHDLTGATILSVLEYVSTLMTLLPNLNEEATLSTIELMIKLVVDLGEGLPIDLASSLLGPGAPLSLLKFSPHPEVAMNMIQLYRSFLQQPLLHQPVMWLMKTETDPAVAVLISSHEDMLLHETIEAAEAVLAFHMQAVAECVSTVDTLDLLLQWRPENLLLARRCPAIHYALLTLIHRHCVRFQNNVNSALFLSPETNYHFPAIVLVMTRLLEERLPTNTLFLLLEWARELLLDCQPFLSLLVQLEYIQGFVKAIVSVGKYKYCDHVVLQVAACLDLLVPFSCNISKPEIVSEMIEVCMNNSNAVNPEVSETFSNLLPRVSLCRTLAVVTDNVQPLSRPITSLLRSHVTRTYSGLLSTRNFKLFMDYLLRGETHPDCSWLEELFLESYPLGLQSESASALTLKHTARRTRSVLLPWLCYEAAQTCVLNKLRTSLGKPPETFTAFEAALKALARDATETSVDTITRARVLLEFMEWLEKVIYNASEGSLTLSAPPKNVRTFFHANKKTCINWLTRNRLVMGVIGVRSGQPAAAVRCTHALLAELVHNRNTNSSEFDMTVLYCAWALLCLRDPQVITGLYVWCQKEADRTFSWLVPLSHHASNRFEVAIEGYKAVLSERQSSPIPINTDIDKNEENSNASPIKIARPAIDNTTLRFIYDCLLDCYRKIEDFDGLAQCLAKREAILRDAKNGASVEKFLEPPWKYENIKFMKNIHEILLNRSSKYKWKARVLETSAPGANDDDIKSLDNSILDAKIRFPSSDYNERCKEALSQLSDWSLVTQPEFSPHWKMDSFTETLKQNLINDAVFMHIGKSLDSKSVVLQMSENNKIEIDLHVNQLMDQWGANYDFELSNMLKEVKERYGKGKHVAIERLESNAKIVKNLLRERLRSGRVEPSRDLIILDVAARDVLYEGKNIQQVNVPSKQQRLSSDVLLHLAFWKRLLGEDDLKLQVLKAARKEGNLRLARRCLLWHFKGSAGEERDLVDICDELVENFDRNMSLVEGELCLQVAKLLNCTGATASAMDFASLTALKLIRPDNSEPVRECGSRMLLSLAKWLQRLPGHRETPEAVHNLIQIPDGVLDDLLSMPCHTINGQVVIPDHHMAIGRVLSMSVAHCSSLAKTWSQFASWCYRWGRKMVDASAHVEVSLTEQDLLKIKQVLPDNTTEAELVDIVNIISNTRAAPDEDNIQTENLSTLENIQSQLKTVPCLAGVSFDVLISLIEVWRQSQGRVSSGYRKAAQAYFKYLHLCAPSQYSDTRTLTATLRILRLLVKHAVELQDLLEEELPSTPPLPWQGIIPQLFSRLNHPEAYVRARLAELLCRIAQTAPNLIIFPAVVGSSAGANRIADFNSSTSKLLATCMSQNSDDDGEEQEEEEDEYENVATDTECSALTNCYKSMVDTLSKQTPEAIQQVQQFVSELRRITLLWDELWLGTLNQHHGEVTRRLCQLEQEVRKVDNNPHLSAAEKPALIAEKHRIVMKPVVFVLEQLQAITSVTSETPHEVWFQEKLGDAINSALDKLTNPADPRDPQASWHSFRAIHAKLQKRAHKRASTILNMENISPVLYNMKDTAIPMPGVSGLPLVTIAGVSNNVSVLPTKTKPKKLVFYSNKGTTHTYLFKGLEDLHLDERIMQFLTIANTMLASRGNTDYKARHYSVTPLGPRSGLISWVDRVIPLFMLYKKWQQRESAAKQLSAPHTSQLPQRPSELFYNKLTPLLKEAGVSVERRKEWPLPILKQVLQELMNETPSDLLAKELWCNSLHVDEWWQTTKTYCRSVAVMSVIGYIIGLGDRHLDNVLIDLHTGEVVHIDYNVCFEKGKTLRVPEKVPFRMTQNIREALGVTGLEGQFQLSCEHVLTVLKQARETLLPLLEAFVYDPLIDWTPGSESGYTGAVYGGGEGAKETRQSRKALEREVTRAMFVVRITEMKTEWIHNREKVVGVLGEVCGHIERYLSLSREGERVEESLADGHEQMLVVKEAEAVGGHHPLYNLANRCALLLKARSAHQVLKQTLKEKRDEYQRDILNYENALREMTGEGLSQWMEQLTSPLHPDSFSMFDLVKQFLQTAGQGIMVSQCDQTESEMGQLDVKQRQLMRSCVDLLAEYVVLIALYPTNQDCHRARKFKLWADRLLANPTPLECAVVLSEFQANFGDHSTRSCVLAKQAIAYSSALQSAFTEAQSKLKRALDLCKSDGVAMGVDTVKGLDEARMNLKEMARMDRKAGLAVELVLISTLCSLNQRFIKMETIAKSAEEGLEGMRLKDGQNWLEEMSVVSGLMVELTGMLPSSANEEATVHAALNTLRKTHAIFRELLELHVNFHSIILPEALKCATTQHPDMVAMMENLRATITLSGTNLDDLQKQLKLHLRALIMDMKSQHGDVQYRVARLRDGLSELLQRPCLDAGQSPGQMLLMGFHGMFEKLAVEGRQMLALLSQLPVVPAWRKLDQLREASTLTALVLDGRTRSTTEDVFLVRRVQTMQEFFSLCETAGSAFRGASAPVVLDDDRLNRPIRRFSAEFVGRIMLGATSQAVATAICFLIERLGFNLSGEIENRDLGPDSKISLEELCRRAMDSSLQKGLTSNLLVSQATVLTVALQTRYREQERSKMLTESVAARERSLTRLQTLLTAHSWYHEDALLEAGGAAPALHSRSSFMTKLRKASSALLSLQTRMTEAREAQRLLVGSVEQRLRWAGGANPALVEVLAAFEAGISALDHRLDTDMALAVRLGSVCSAVLRHEALRTRTTEAILHDESMLKVVEECKEMAGWRAGCCELVSPAEESLLELMTPESAGDPQHLHKLEIKISENIEKMKARRGSLNDKMAQVRVDCETEMEKLKALLGNHHALMTDVRHLLKSMAKLEEWNGAGVAEYLERYREFSENIGVVVSLLVSDKPFTTEDVTKALQQLNLLQDQIVGIYEDLIGFADKNRADGKKRPPLLRQESVCGSPKHLGTHQTNQRAGKGLQERNAYALSVWRRIQMKLEGRDPDPGRRSAPQEQVDYVIGEATSLENLALLYEGWTAWV